MMTNAPLWDVHITYVAQISAQTSTGALEDALRLVRNNDPAVHVRVRVEHVLPFNHPFQPFDPPQPPTPEPTPGPAPNEGNNRG